MWGSAMHACVPSIVFILWQLLGGNPKPFSKFHVPSFSLSIGCIDGLLYFLVINFILNHHSHKRDSLSVSR